MCCKDPVTTVFITVPALIGAQHIGRNPACPPPPMRPLCYILNVWVTYLVCCQVMFMCIGLHVRTVWLCVCLCVWRSSCVPVCTGSVDRSSRKKTCVAEKFLWSLTITNSWKQPVTKWPLAQKFGDLGGHCWKTLGCEGLSGRTGWRGGCLYMSAWYHHKSHHPFLICKVSYQISH